MKKIKFLVTSLCFILALSIFSVKNVAAATTIDTSSLEANQIVGGEGVTAVYTSEGILAEVPGADTVGTSEAWRYGATILGDSATAGIASIANDSKVSMEFSIEYYDSYGNLVSKGQNSYAIDIYVYNRADNSKLAMLRIWADSGTWNAGNHSWVVGGSWGQVGNSWWWQKETHDDSKWINGDATLSSSFYFEFDKAELFKSYYNHGNTLTRLDYNDTLKNAVNTNGVDDVYFRIEGENGFTNTTRVLVRSINGQPLVKSSSGGGSGSDSEVSFVTPGGSSKVGLVSEGVKVNPAANTVTKFGVFDLKHGLDVKFAIPQLGGANYFDLNLTNVTNGNYSLKYRIWLDNEDNGKRPTNVYIKTNGSEVEYGNAGWISKIVDGIIEKFHLGFDMTDSLLGEREDGTLMPIENGSSQIRTFMNACPSSKFYVGFEMGNASSSSEYIVTEINEQSLVNVGGVYEKVNDAVLYVDDLPKSVAQNNTLDINTYSKDIFADTVNKVVITAPDNQVSEQETTGVLRYKFDQLGTYNIEISTVGSNGNKVSKNYTVSCKTTVADITFTLPSYSQNMSQIGDQITILAASNYSANVITKKIILVMPWTNEERVVNVGDKITFEGPGVYTIKYIAQDAALPTPNELVQEVNISVVDEVEPVVNVTLPTTANTGDSISFNVSVTDQSDYDVAIYVTFPDQTVQRYSLTDQFVPTKSGTYQVKVVVEDMYWNITTVIKEMVVSGNDIEDSGSGDDPFDDMFDDDDPFGGFDDFEDTNDSSNAAGGDFMNVLIGIGVAILIFLPGVLVYIIKSRKFK